MEVPRLSPAPLRRPAPKLGSKLGLPARRRNQKKRDVQPLAADAVLHASFSPGGMIPIVKTGGWQQGALATLDF
jgi:hypothetical protein